MTLRERITINKMSWVREIQYRRRIRGRKGRGCVHELLVHALDPALQDREKFLDGVGMNIVANVFVFGVLDGSVRGEIPADASEHVPRRMVVCLTGGLKAALMYAVQGRDNSGLATQREGSHVRRGGRIVASKIKSIRQLVYGDR
jgi:hypothetical protein